MNASHRLIFGAGLLGLASSFGATYFFASDQSAGEELALNSHRESRGGSTPTPPPAATQFKKAMSSLTTSKPRSGRGLDATGDKANALEAELASVKKQLQALQQEFRTFASNSAANQYQTEETTSDQDIETEHLTEAISVEEEQDIAFAHIDAVNENFQSQEADPEWSAEALDALETALQSEELSGTSVVDMECRATLCRVEVEHRDPAEMMNFEMWLPEKLAPVLPRMTLEREELDGRTTTIVYLARDGHSLTLADSAQ